MRKIKLELKFRVPSWGFCIHDVYTEDLRQSKDVCRFCVKDRKGHYSCVLYDESLASDPDFIYKTKRCLDATAGYAVTLDEPTPKAPIVDPKQIIREALSIYNKTLNDLIKQGYPRQLAEKVAQQHLLSDE